ncbi:cation:proton antiporter domain-containing protein [Fulvivirga lutea]|uniref:Cation:proton antiporter n=1 Tax=Fulvivirga lutea TaxID=2810512 RepID=A0A974WGR9_9BACT|nr:cation:proton antiporter [Fulvivirga lutea]QSE98249.1 cation:proton antiporter [Fulvivirga lutea]
MELINPYTIVIILSLIIIISYLFNLLSTKSGIPSVLLLIGLGIILNALGKYVGIPKTTYLFDILEILGIVGLIMIVLEAALDLELNRSKWPVIWKSLLVAFLSLVGSSLVVAGVLNYFLVDDYILALVYAIPVSVISSAIVIPSVGEMTPEKREFMIYESTFSDILGIMYFYFLVGNIDNSSAQAVVWDISLNIFITVLISVVSSYALVLVFQRLKTQVKLFLLIAVLLLLYSVGKLFHLSSLLIILIFGLVLNNYKLFFRGKLASFLDVKSVHSILSNFHLVTIETAFVVRTLFFVLFGISIDLNALKDLNALGISLVIVILMLGIRAIFLKLIIRKDLKPQLLMAPRGLITILLYFSIPAAFQVEGFNSSIYLYTILITSGLMAIALIAEGKHLAPVDAMQMAYWREMDKEIENIPEQDKHREPEENEESK